MVTAVSNTSCDTVQQGFQCSPDISHYWGQYSPYFAVPPGHGSNHIDNALPQGCTLTFVQILSRHGARDPTSSKTALYAALVDKIHANATSYGPGFEFVEAYEYTLGADQLTAFGQQEMVNSGTKFYERYAALTRAHSPFVRSSGQDRVVESARNWTQGFHAARLADEAANGRPDAYPYDIVTISEDAGSNNTLDHGLCTAFEDGAASAVGDDAQAEWLAVFAPNITARLNAGLPGAGLADADTISLMDLCPYETVADARGALSAWCGLFTAHEWRAYDHYQSVGKYYGYGGGNPLGPTQGVGFANELVARLTGAPVADRTSTNRTLDADPATFPLNRTLYADFSHDNDLTGIFFALGLYDNRTTPALSTARVQGAEALGGYAASWTVPFAARMYVEKMVCPSASGSGSTEEEEEEEEELVRVLVNDRVRPLANCGADALGRCTLGRFVESLGFAREGGDWDLCFS